MRLKALILVMTAALCLTPLAARAADPPPDHWVATWATASYPMPGTAGHFGQADTTYREIVRSSLPGPLLRVEFTNRFGTEPLRIGAAHIALAAPKGEIQLTSANALTFNGRPSIVIPAGAVAVSDPAALNVPADTDLAVSIFIPAQAIDVVSQHGAAFTTSYIAQGNVVGQKSLPSPQTSTSWAFLKAVDVLTAYNTEAVVAFGDSITDGTHSTVDGHDSWPALLARRLHDNAKTKHVAIVNEGIGGNRLLHSGAGPSALARFDDDCITLPGVHYLILLEGINDIGHAEDGDPTHTPGHDATTEDLIQADVQLIARAHDHGIKVYLATLTPYQGATYASPIGQKMRDDLNTWIRTQKLADGVLDFDEATRDKSNPEVYASANDSGDHLHPNPTGYKAIANSIDLKLFELNKQEKYDITHQP